VPRRPLVRGYTYGSRAPRTCLQRLVGLGPQVAGDVTQRLHPAHLRGHAGPLVHAAHKHSTSYVNRRPRGTDPLCAIRLRALCTSNTSDVRAYTSASILSRRVGPLGAPSSSVTAATGPRRLSVETCSRPQTPPVITSRSHPLGSVHAPGRTLEGKRNTLNPASPVSQPL
jgi:hypothetical protein